MKNPPDVPMIVLAPGIGDSVLEQIVLAQYMRGGDSAIQKPYAVKTVEQPLSKFYANQLSISSLVNRSFKSWNEVASFFASEQVLVVPPLNEDMAVAQMKQRYSQARKKLDSLHYDSPGVEDLLWEMADAIKIGARLRVPSAVAFYLDYLTNFKRPADLRVAVHFDFHRRIVDKSLQDTAGSSRETVAKLASVFESQPNLKNLRMLDVFARNHAGLEIDTNSTDLFSLVRNCYIDFLKQNSLSHQQRESAFASLVAFDMLLNEKDRALFDFNSMKYFGPGVNDKIAFVGSLLGLSSYHSAAPILGLVGLAEHHDPKLAGQISEQVFSYIADTRQLRTNSIVYTFEEMLNYCKKTVLKEVIYSINKKELLTVSIYNQKPYLKFKNQLAAEQTRDSFVVTQLVDPEFKGVGKKLGFWLMGSYEEIRAGTRRYTNNHVEKGISSYLSSVSDLNSDVYSTARDFISPQNPKVRISYNVS